MRLPTAAQVGCPEGSRALSETSNRRICRYNKRSHLRFLPRLPAGRSTIQRHDGETGACLRTDTRPFSENPMLSAQYTMQ